MQISFIHVIYYTIIGNTIDQSIEMLKVRLC